MAKAAPEYKSRPRRSEKLTDQLIQNLNDYIATFEIAEMGAESLGMTRQTLHRIFKFKSASGRNVEKIKELKMVTDLSLQDQETEK
jgi:hypothetical protein